MTSILICIGPELGDGFVHYNNSKPWWRKKRPVFWIKPNYTWNYEFPYKIDMDKFFIKFDLSEKLYPLSEYSVVTYFKYQ